MRTHPPPEEKRRAIDGNRPAAQLSLPQSNANIVALPVRPAIGKRLCAVCRIPFRPRYPTHRLCPPCFHHVTAAEAIRIALKAQRQANA